MLAALLFVLLAMVSGAFYAAYQKQQAQIAMLKKAREKIQLEEARVFDFLHGLGEAFTEDIRPGDLHRLIVEGASKILDAHGGALYLIGKQGAMLLPSFISKDCPPLVEIPQNILKQSETLPLALQSYVRLHSIEPGEGILGTVWRDKEPLFLSGDDARLSNLRENTQITTSAMFSPLIFGHQNLGVIAVAKGPMSTPFTPSDFAVFKAIAEQSAFALYNAIVYSEASEKRRLDLDLLVAQDIQRILLPSAAPDVEGFQIAGVNIPARQVSGDYFDYIRIDDCHTGIVIADVSGKGVPASLIMAMCRSVLRSTAAGNCSGADVLRKVNSQLYPDIKEDMFISMAYLVLNSHDKQITLCRAGHDAPLLYSAKEKTVTKINPPGMALGIDSGDVFDRITRDFPVTMEQDDCLILYTDGVTEALDSNGFEFGMKQMILSIQASAADGASAVVKRLTDDLRNFIGTYPQNDDITLIVIRKK
ncbi:MAG TPA: GAF domain-containing SpoIIE family protein phosphatase [Chthoniobacteraceae bacterium]|nr:GAF domain-containing SpoIIE family protein phosphatase [Chthoniobacteraceae bacterium]